MSASLRDRVSGYIERQEPHHKKYSFIEELQALLKKHGVSYDVKYLE